MTYNELEYFLKGIITIDYIRLTHLMHTLELTDEKNLKDLNIMKIMISLLVQILYWKLKASYKNNSKTWRSRKKYYKGRWSFQGNAQR